VLEKLDADEVSSDLAMEDRTQYLDLTKRKLSLKRQSSFKGF
jgi:hypothetical protein